MKNPNGYFLSCLCGSDLNEIIVISCLGFLSCLCGSDRMGTDLLRPASFLSCLCGSDLAVCFPSPGL